MKLRQAMAGLHTWGGLLPSWLLYVIIFTGSIACFDKELERWMRPALHVSQENTLSADQLRDWLAQNVSEPLHAIWIHPPTAREPFWRLIWVPYNGDEQQRRLFAPDGREPMADTLGGEFFFTLHYNLQAGLPGMYIVGLAGMFMLVALVSGVILHRRIFKDMFTLRPQANTQRAWLDVHNLFGVLGLPFHLLMAYSGLVIFVASYMPAGAQVAYQGDIEHFFGEVAGSYHRDELHQPASRAVSLDALLADARQRWGGGEPGWLNIEHPADASAVVAVRRYDRSRIAAPLDTLSYDAATGELLHRQQAATGYRVYNWLTGLHMAQFGDSLVRLLYLLLGLCGCAMLVGGLRVWLAKREARGGVAVGCVRLLNTTVFAGLPLASLALLWANRLLSQSLEWRVSAEAWVFVLSWLLVAVLALLWRGQPRRMARLLWIVASVLALGLPLLNGWSTDNGHLLASLGRDDWALAGIDLTLLFAGLVCAGLAWRLRPLEAAEGPGKIGVTAEEPS
ncbi:PepSY-associated TM helix domain-containing protein [Pseudomonas anguilliseptica]|uniref:PepSY-associated TM helix domain-containing protein n=1 Tax=Pseudomonas anguilliseptica TaxID=53406 RepID=UPI0037369664